MSGNITVFGTDNCEDTRRVRAFLDSRGTHYQYVNVDKDQEAAEMVKRENEGNLRTPLVNVQFGTEARVLRVPSNEDLENALRDLEPLGRVA